MTGTSTTGTTWPRILWITGTVLMVTMLVHIAALVVTGGPWTGPVSLRKPATFAETGWLVCWSAALIIPRLRMRTWQRHVVGGSVAVFGVVETAVMGVQAWRGVPSHYNFTTPLDAALMRGGAAGTAAVFLIGTLVLLVAAVRSADTSVSIRVGVVAGVAVLLLGSVIGPDAATIGTEYLLIRPATDGGDLVLVHAIGVHGLILLAVPAVLLARTAMPAARQLRVVLVAVTAVAVATAILLVHALNRLPLGQLPPAALIGLGLCAAALLGAYATIARAMTRGPKITEVSS